MSAAPGNVQAAFAAALRDPDPDAIPDGFDSAAARRFRVYRNNVRVALVEALAAAYPTTEKLVGEPFFRAMALAYAASTPARARTLNLYGERFAAFIAGFAPARDLPYLADVARLERAVLESRHAADAMPLDPVAAAGLGVALATACLVQHPATRLVASDYPLAAIWHAHSGAEPAGRDLVFSVGAAGALVCRPAYAVTVRTLDPAGCAFAATLLAGDDLATANDRATALAPDFDVMTAFRDLLSAGAFQGVVADHEKGP